MTTKEKLSWTRWWGSVIAMALGLERQDAQVVHDGRQDLVSHRLEAHMCDTLREEEARRFSIEVLNGGRQSA